MRIVARIADVRAAIAEARGAGRRIALIPTMGALHAGHLSLVNVALRRGAFAVMSIFVNPLQFGPSEDFSRYPRDADGDSARARAAGVDLLFMPDAAELGMADAAVAVTPRIAADRWEGAIRPGHFAGVLTIVAKLFNILRPDMAVFGQKDVQQATLIGAMIRTLDFPIELVIAPTVREPDGLAMSSRNVYLSPGDRVEALSLSRALGAVNAAWQAGNHDARALERIGVDILAGEKGVAPDYFAVVEPRTLAPAISAEPGSIVITAARVGATRLIDNVILGGSGLGVTAGEPTPSARRPRDGAERR